MDLDGQILGFVSCGGGRKMQFCPDCSSMLEYELHLEGGGFRCLLCNYFCKIQPGAKIVREKVLRKKEMDIFVSENDALERMQKSDTMCPNCHHGQAAYYEQQTRSADEPATLFFTCLQCKHKWNQ